MRLHVGFLMDEGATSAQQELARGTEQLRSLLSNAESYEDSEGYVFRWETDRVATWKVL